MEQENENEDQPDANGRTAELLNGDIGDGNTGQDDEGSSPQADWTGTASHAGSEDSVADHKVPCVSAADSNSLCCIFRSCHDCCLAALHSLENRRFNAECTPAFPQRCNDALPHVCVCVSVCAGPPIICTWRGVEQHPFIPTHTVSSSEYKYRRSRAVSVLPASDGQYRNNTQKLLAV